jgi:hypothetical protein
VPEVQDYGSEEKEEELRFDLAWLMLEKQDGVNVPDAGGHSRMWSRG